MNDDITSHPSFTEGATLAESWSRWLESQTDLDLELIFTFDQDTANRLRRILQTVTTTRAERPREPVVARRGDMGEGRKLQLLRESDGDIIVSVLPESHRFTEDSVQFCTPFMGGGSSPKTHAALVALFEAMHEDQVGRP